ncbi:hypothetical protein AQUCO_04300003v1 [Aquilegia coerulea]|uniref:Protein kinase domain-containing protein n=1 Tax=Aquilegia coerulea TaxID=218851 RepID=A0A2G5CNK8_AQUCA|nr:hypothetical protein AQUCO_04300003v1 [Aquilegia coerulea]
MKFKCFITSSSSSMEIFSKTFTLTLLFLFLLNLVYEGESRTESQQHILAQSPSSPSKVNHLNIRLRRIIVGVLFGCLTGLISAILFAFLIRFVLRYMNRTPILKGPVIFSPKIASTTLQLALSNENQLLGSSPNGKYYRTVLDNGLTIAVKRLEPFNNGAQETQNKSTKRRIQKELEMLAGVRHRNMMSLRAYVRDSSRFSLVYDYVPSGSLEDAMNRVRENQLQLDWEARHRIAIGVIKGLQYLHFNCSPRILHYNLKPSNVMLDAEFEPRLGDCGLAHLMPNWGRTTSSYTAPECFQNCRDMVCFMLNSHFHI